ncbi:MULTISPECIES: Vps62-related protein [unclassified Janthinobacterium]|uniref:Vps62-related protein n=1 Tax=unclassified Janthinobacterium TaxID=2610881 RepID=UPI0016113023|nr:MULTISPECIES: Vps62-related protein [unclassified Janthinobacterium]MBB5367088.1 hypothetical protein [Janthinobacterium sp. K2C7]MBB5380434.1 hypothetical protein [Janthinobacterium sp. K2Li3]MBB5385470.1 hypothetical protein [Janthinobacterium sp. K2E3]
MTTITVYAEGNYAGTSQALAPGRYDMDALRVVGNDTISSIKVPDGWSVTLFEHAGFQGRSKVITADTPMLGDGFNDLVSSITVSDAAASAGVVSVYADANFSGKSQTLAPGSYDMGALGGVGNDTISSLRVPAGWRVTLYEHAGFQGRSQIVTADITMLGEAFNDQVSSITVSAPSASGGAVMVYADGNFSGTTQALQPGRYDMAALAAVGNDTISSLRVPAGWSATLYEHAGFQGRSKLITADTPMLDDGFNDLVSSIVVSNVVAPAPAPAPLGTNVPASAEQLRIASRMARIALRREATPEERKHWGGVLASQATPGDGVVVLAQELMRHGEIAKLDASARIARAHDAMLQRYDATPPRDLAHWLQRSQLDNQSVNDLINNNFKGIVASGYRSDACAAPVDAAQPMFAVRDAAGSPLVFAIGSNRQLYLFRRTGQSWRQLALSAVLPAPRHGHVQGLDVQQAADGSIALAFAMAPRRGVAISTVFVATGLSNALDDNGWIDAIGKLPARTGAPAGTVVSQISFAPAGGGASLLVLVGAAVAGITNSYYFDAAAAPAAWKTLRIPEDANSVRGYALGTFRRPGIWTLYQVNNDSALTFTSFEDAFGKTINVSYTGLPAAVSSFRLAPGSDPDVPDVYVAGNGLAVYRAKADAPERIANVDGAAIVWVGAAPGASHVAYVDASQALYVVTRKAGEPWGQPYLVSGGLDKVALLGNPVGAALDMLAITPGGALELRRIATPGSAAAVEEIPQCAVWDEDPMTLAELNVAIDAAAPVVYFASDEEYFSSTVDIFLRRVGLWNEMRGVWQMPPGTLWDAASGDVRSDALAILPRSAPDNPKHDSDYVLKIDEADYKSLLPGHPDDGPLYVHAKFLPAENATDLIFWIFCPYNGAGMLKLDTPGLNRRIDLAPLGVHEGDWEHFLVRIDNDTGKPVKLFLSAHDSGDWKDIASLERDAATRRLVLYTSRHGHAFYSTAGDNLSNDRSGGIWAIGLINHCDQGKRINFGDPGRSRLVSAGFLAHDAPLEPLWLQMPWRWGRYFDFSRADISNVIRKVLGPVVGSTPFFGALSEAAAEILIDKKVLGGEGNSAGPQAIKFKGNWFGQE